MIMVDEQQIWHILEQIPDPEIPVISIVELGIVRDVTTNEQGVEIKITPTYSGCPAMHAIEEDIVRVMSEKGVSPVKIKKVFAPAWTTDWLSDKTKQKLKEYGIAPPEKSDPTAGGLAPFTRPTPGCPFCDSQNCELKSEFGSTPCKALYYCQDCQQPFEHFKCI